MKIGDGMNAYMVYQVNTVVSLLHNLLPISVQEGSHYYITCVFPDKYSSIQTKSICSEKKVQ